MINNNIENEASALNADCRCQESDQREGAALSIIKQNTNVVNKLYYIHLGRMNPEENSIVKIEQISVKSSTRTANLRTTTTNFHLRLANDFSLAFQKEVQDFVWP